MQGANMNEIVKMAQQVASNIAQNQTEPMDPNNMDMGKILSQVTQSVSTMLTPDMLEKMSGSNPLDSEVKPRSPKKKIKSKIQLDESAIEELDDNDENTNKYESIAPRTKDLHFSLNVTLEELYHGKVKKLAVRRKKLEEKGNKKVQVEEKKKLSVKIEPGMFDEQVITFNKQADEKEGYETGDIVITLCCADHETFEREGNNLMIEKEISIYEAYNCEMTIQHLNGHEFNVSSERINIFGEEMDSFRKLKGFGMPILGESKQYGDLIIHFKPVMKTKLTTEQLNVLAEIFPKLNERKDLTSGKVFELELATESDFEYSSDEDSDEEDSDEEDSDEEEESEEDSDD